jgi:hypothetical protein
MQLFSMFLVMGEDTLLWNTMDVAKYAIYSFQIFNYS